MKRKGRMEEHTDDRLVHLAKSGEIDAFTELAQRHQERIYRMILSLTRNHQDSDDLVQETFLQAYRALKKFRQHSSFFTWLYRIAINLTLNFLKRNRPEKMRYDVELDTVEDGQAGASGETSPEARSLRAELKQKLNSAIESLPSIYRIAFILVEKQGMSHKQASLVLKCSEKTVSWRMHRARKMLQTRLGAYFKRGIS